MKKLLFTLIAIAFINLSMAQTKVAIAFTKDKVVILNDIKLSTANSIEDIEKILGKGTVYKEYASGKINYHFKEHGISVHTVKEKLLFIGMNFNWDGDKTFPETNYTGSFKIDDLVIDNKSSEKIIEEIKNVQVKRVYPGLYMSNPKEESTPIIIGFKDDLITQVGFEFH